MKRTAVVVVTAAIVCLTAGVFAQTVPSFAGKWTLVADPNAPPVMGGLGQGATIVQDATSMTVTRTTQMGEFTSTYKLDGSDSKNTMNMGGNSIDMVSKVKVDGGKLTVKTSMSFDGNPVEASMTLSLDATGNLVVDSTRPDIQGGGAPITAKMTYKKN